MRPGLLCPLVCREAELVWIVGRCACVVLTVHDLTDGSLEDVGHVWVDWD